MDTVQTLSELYKLMIEMTKIAKAAHQSEVIYPFGFGRRDPKVQYFYYLCSDLRAIGIFDSWEVQRYKKYEVLRVLVMFTVMKSHLETR